MFRYFVFYPVINYCTSFCNIIYKRSPSEVNNILYLIVKKLIELYMLCNKLLTLNHDNNQGNADKSKYLEYSLYSLLYPLFPSLQRPAFNAVSTTTTKVKSRLKSIYLYNTSLESIKLLWFVVLFKMLLYNLFCCINKVRLK